jgi:hypothetical protein
MQTAKTESARAAQKAFIEPFEQPVSVFLRNRASVKVLLDAITHFRCTCSLDGVLDVL